MQARGEKGSHDTVGLRIQGTAHFYLRSESVRVEHLHWLYGQEEVCVFTRLLRGKEMTLNVR